MLGGLIRPGISFSHAELRKLSAAPFQPDWLDRLLFRAMAIGFAIVAGLAAFALAAFAWAMIAVSFH